MRVVAILLAPVLCLVLRECCASGPHTARLTTFGTQGAKPNSNNNTHAPPVVKGRDCKTTADCSGIQNTACMTDSKDGKMRCLCGDKSQPKNGACTNKPKALRAHCVANKEKECIENAECAPGNGTNSMLCQCKEGFMEDDMECNGCFLGVIPASFLTTLLFGLYPALLNI